MITLLRKQRLKHIKDFMSFAMCVSILTERCAVCMCVCSWPVVAAAAQVVDKCHKSMKQMVHGIAKCANNWLINSHNSSL